MANLFICRWPVQPQGSSQGSVQGHMVGQGRSSTQTHVAITHSISQAFKAIFIWPTSTDNLGNEPQEPRPSRKCCCGDRRTHANITNLIGMQTAEPRAIAYVACQVHRQSTICSDCGALSPFLASLHPVIMWILGSC